MVQLIKNESLTERVYQAIRHGILTNDLEQGQALVIDALAKDLGVSTTPVREALRRLAGDGLITLQMNRTPIVTELSQSETSEIFATRRVLEPHAVLRIMQRTREHSEFRERIQQLGVSLEKLVALVDADPVSPEVYEEYIEADGAFQDLLAHGTEGSLLGRLVEICNSYVFRLRVFSEASSPATRVDRMVSVIGEHLAIIEAITADDEDAALTALHDHLEQGEKRTLNGFEGLDVPVTSPSSRSGQ